MSLWLIVAGTPVMKIVIRGTLSGDEIGPIDFEMDLTLNGGNEHGYQVDGVVRYGGPASLADYANRIDGRLEKGALVLAEGDNLWAKRGVEPRTGRTFSIDLPDTNGRVFGSWWDAGARGLLEASVGLPMGELVRDLKDYRP